jgi:Ribbon-helix-helix protein, copG family
MRHIYAMKRTTVFLDEQTILRLQRVAERTGVSAASLVREAVAQYLAAPANASPLPSVAGQFASGASDTSERVDELLWTDPHA